MENVRRQVSSAQFGTFSLPDSERTDVDLLVLGLAVRRLREQRALSVDELAAAIDVRRQRIDALETGRLDPSYELLLAIAEALGVPPSALVALAEELRGANES